MNDAIRDRIIGIARGCHQDCFGDVLPESWGDTADLILQEFDVTPKLASSDGYEEFAIKIDDGWFVSPPGTDCECDWIFETRDQAEALIAARRSGGDTHDYQIMSRMVSEFHAVAPRPDKGD